MAKSSPAKKPLVGKGAPKPAAKKAKAGSYGSTGLIVRKMLKKAPGTGGTGLKAKGGKTT